jgi:hypothetical protein
MTGPSEGKRMAEQAAIIVEMINRYYPEFKQSEKNAEDMRIPVVV